MAAQDDAKHEALQPIHESMAGILDWGFRKLYNANIANTPPKPLDLNTLRSNYSSLYSFATAPAPEVGRIYDDTVTLEDGTEIPVRVYEPESCASWSPVHVNFHGGGWALGDLNTDSHLCRHYCHRANVVVIDVAYRLAPEFPFPTAITDSFGALKYIHEHGERRFRIRPSSISVGGVSAGGTIALALSYLAHGVSIPIRLVAAGAPVIDDISQYATAADSPWPSMRDCEFAPTLNWARLKWFDRLKWAGADPAAREKADWFANLLKMPMSSSDAHRTVIFTSGADPLRDEGERYAQMMVAAGLNVTLRRFLGMPHPFMHMDKDLGQAREFIDLTAREIRLAHWDPYPPVPTA